VTPVAAAVVGGAVALAVPRHRTRAACAVALGLWQPPLLGLAAAGGWLVIRWRRLGESRRQASRRRDAIALFAELVFLGLSAGLPFVGAVEAATEAAPGEIVEEARATLRQARSVGASTAMAGARGELAPLFRMAGRAMVSGAPLAAAVSSFVAEARKERAAARAAAAKRLPVRLLLPLTLLILPGFVVLTLGPAVLSGIDRIMKGVP
jgi:hypothetical protein